MTLVMARALAGDWAVPVPGLRLSVTPGHAVRRIQVYGERCSGTHLITKLIERNLGRDAGTRAFGFKHWFVPDQVLFADDALALVIAREPATWLRSLHKHPWHTAPAVAALGFETFLRTEWASFWDLAFAGVGPDHPMLGREMMHERDPATGLRFANPVVLRTAKLRHWSALRERAHHVALLSYEALRDDPQGIVAALGDVLGIAVEGFEGVESYKGQGYFAYKPSTYAPLSDADAAFVDAWLDPATEALFAA